MITLIVACEMEFDINNIRLNRILCYGADE